MALQSKSDRPTRTQLASTDHVFVLGAVFHSLAMPFCPRRVLAQQKRTSEHLHARSRYPVGRVGVPADIANAIAFLVSDEAAFISEPFLCHFLYRRTVTLELY